MRSKVRRKLEKSLSLKRDKKILKRIGEKPLVFAE